VLWLYDVEGMTHAEIAAALNRSVPWSKTRLSRARARMRALLGAHRVQETQGRALDHGH
jgi:RNA polymerase sigma-70 factor (ECF subfamily)